MHHNFERLSVTMGPQEELVDRIKDFEDERIRLMGELVILGDKYED